ncbi:hypothetical protein J6590_045727, partial [Homalodisca vitripennis]
MAKFLAKFNANALLNTFSHIDTQQYCTEQSAARPSSPITGSSRSVTPRPPTGRRSDTFWTDLSKARDGNNRDGYVKEELLSNGTENHSLGDGGELNKSSNSNKTFGRRPDLGHSKNVFSASMQVKKMKENSLYPVKLPDITSQSQEVHLSGKEGETDRLSLNESGSKYFHSTVDHHKGNINKLQVVAQVHGPDIHSEGTILTVKEDRNIKNTISNKKPPCTAKLLEQGDTYEKFLERNSEVQCKINWLHSKNFFSKADSEDKERPLSTVTSLHRLPHNTLTGPASIHQSQPSEELNCCNVEENIKS